MPTFLYRCPNTQFGSKTTQPKKPPEDTSGDEDTYDLHRVPPAPSGESYYGGQGGNRRTGGSAPPETVAMLGTAFDKTIAAIRAPTG
jgi:hypothetical protein